jgi:hypothetical protein
MSASPRRNDLPIDSDPLALRLPPCFASCITLGLGEAFDLHLQEVLWAEPITLRKKRCEIERYLLQLGTEVEKDGDGRFGIFHAWEDED